jgi:DNA helicase-2/ATP-dependent DNA helicase PcrA
VRRRTLLLGWISIEIYELDERKRKPRSVDTDFIQDVKDKVGAAAQALRRNAMPPNAPASTCIKCDYVGMCTAGTQIIQPVP